MAWMDATALKRLAHVATLAKVEPSPRPITLTPRKSGLAAVYSGQYASAIIVVPAVGALDKAVSVGSKEFLDVSAIFRPKEEVDLKALGSSLSVEVGGTKRATLRYTGTPDSALLDGLGQLQQSATLSMHTFKAEAIVTASMAAVDYAMPILQGIRLRITQAGLDLYASDGVSASYHTTVPVVTFRSPLDCVVPAKDLRDTLGILTGEVVGISLYKTSIVLRGTDAILRLPTMPGKWPLPDAVGAAEVLNLHAVVGADTIKSLVAASKTYHTTDVVMRPAKGGGVIIETPGSEAGALQERTDGYLTQPVRFSLASIQQAAHLSEDGAVTLSIGERSAFSARGGRRLLLNMRAG